MRLSLEDLADTDLFDCCIVGTGPAGMSCALALAGAGRRVALLEGGGDAYSESSQALYRGDVVGDPYFDLDECRLRYLGGTSNHWAGWCRPLDAIDFAAKGSHRQTAWPIGRADLDPYLAAASDILEIPPVKPSRGLPGGHVEETDYVFSPPVQFDDKYRRRIESDGSVFLVTDASLTRLETNGNDITGAYVVSREGIRRTVRASAYVLATGGIENSRLLLWSNAESGGQVVKRAETLGRYWMEHPEFKLGEVILVGEFAFQMNESQEIGIFAPTAASIERLDILNCSLRVEPLDRTGAKRLIAEVACIAPEWAGWAARQLGQNFACGAILRAAWEQEPRAENRVELGPERDGLGIPRVRLHWRKSETDRQTARAAAEELGVYLAESDTGRMRLDPWLIEGEPFPADDWLGGKHHMGGTRMAESPATGVVDSDCRVFGQSNLYIAGSSVFPSCGYAPPTLTIVQLALRLADHLQARL